MSLTRILAVLALVALAGCEQNDQPAKAPDVNVLKTQQEALDQAKQVGQTLQDAADQQRQQIDAATQ